MQEEYSIVPEQQPITKIEPKATVVIRHVSEGIRRILCKANIRTCFKHRHTLRPKGRNSTVTRMGYGYAKFSVDHTITHMWDKLAEHLNISRKNIKGPLFIFYTTSAVAEHASKTDHMIEWIRLMF